MVKSVLDFIYGAKVAEDAVTWELYDAAEMFSLPHLKIACLRSLHESLNADNCAEMLEAGGRHDLDDAFDHAIEFFKRNRAEVIQTDGWRAFTKRNRMAANALVLLTA